MTKNVQPSAYVRELFSSAQGEGIHVGRRQLFIRFCECHRACRYCDTPRERAESVRIETAPGRGEYVTEPNPVAVPRLLDLTDIVNSPESAHDDLFLTGGEPLLHAGFLAEFLPAVRRRTGLPVHLETSGDLPDALEQVIGWIDHVLMDIKLPSVTGEQETWAAHQSFLERLNSAGVQTTVKVVVHADTAAADLQTATDLLQHSGGSADVVLQPLTAGSLGGSPPTPEQLLLWQSQMKRSIGRCVRIIPQCHKWIGLL